MFAIFIHAGSGGQGKTSSAPPSLSSGVLLASMVRCARPVGATLTCEPAGRLHVYDRAPVGTSVLVRRKNPQLSRRTPDLRAALSSVPARTVRRLDVHTSRRRTTANCAPLPTLRARRPPSCSHAQLRWAPALRVAIGALGSPRLSVRHAGVDRGWAVKPTSRIASGRSTSGDTIQTSQWAGVREKAPSLIVECDGTGGFCRAAESTH